MRLADADSCRDHRAGRGQENPTASGEGRSAAPGAGLRDNTFVTLVKPLLARAALMALTGHVDAAMPERYDVPHLLERAK